MVTEYGCLLQIELCKSECVRIVERRRIAWHFKGKLKSPGSLSRQGTDCETDFLTI